MWFSLGNDSRVAPVLSLGTRLAEVDRDVFSVYSGLKEAPVGQTAHLSRDPSGAGLEMFLDHWKPDLMVRSGTLPPAEILAALNERAIPFVLVDGHRLAARPVPGWLGARGRAWLLSGLRRAFVVTQADADLLLSLRVDRTVIERTGLLEQHGGGTLPCNERERASLAELLAARPVWCAASVTQAEVGAVSEAHRQGSRLSHRLLMLLVPAQPGHGPAIHEQLLDAGWRSALRSAGAEPDPDIQIYVADTDGELGLWFRLAPITFIGRSLFPPGGGIDPFQTAALGSAVVHGPHVAGQEAAFHRLAEAGAARRVSTGAELGAVIGDLLSPDAAALMAHRAWEIVSEGSAVTDRAEAVILAALDRTGGAPDAAA